MPERAAKTQAPATLDPRVPLMLLLSFVTGLVDAISVLGLGKVFTANMTGNVVFLGFAAAGAPNFHALSYLVAIAAFLLGAIVAGRMGKLQVHRSLREWMFRAALIEVVLLWIAAWVSLEFDVAQQRPDERLYAIIALTAISMGFRNATIRQFKIPDLTTTVLTLTLTGLAADSALGGGSNTNWPVRTAAVLAIFVGAVFGALLLAHSGIALALFIAGALVLSGTTAFIIHAPKAHLPSN